MAGTGSVAGFDRLALTVVEDYEALSSLAADLVVDCVTAHPSAAITLPTGETPRGMYEELVRRIRAGKLDFSRVRFFCLDDYLGTSIGDEVSLTGWLDEVFFQPARVPRQHIHLIPTDAPDPHAEAARYDRDIAAAGGLELAIVGLGPNGHVGFNEPGSPPDSRTRVVTLTEESREQNAAYYEGQQTIPPRAVTMGLGTILEARQLVLIVSGESKARILKATLEGAITPAVPGSFLRTAADRLRVIVDKPAASALT
ncbi:MAG TPA: glucosamine-6-phosphate deaminase [Thermomicrobiales bacterium]|nr:glucosamine-6-phosphate deaminase [Thermomicrobiales bacterium]